MIKPVVLPSGPADCEKSTPASSSTSSCSHLQSPPYARLQDEAAASAEASEAAATTPCNDWQPIQLSPSTGAEKAMSYLAVAESAAVEDSSDTESLGRLVIVVGYTYNKRSWRKGGPQVA